MTNPISGTRTTPLVERPSRFSASGSKKTRQAVVAIHGIGQQLPFETTDSIMQAILGDRDVPPSTPVRFLKMDDESHGDSNLPRLTLNLDDKEIDLYEIYWSPLTELKFEARDVFLFFLKSGWLGLYNTTWSSLKSCWNPNRVRNIARDLNVGFVDVLKLCTALMVVLGLWGTLLLPWLTLGSQIIAKVSDSPEVKRFANDCTAYLYGSAMGLPVILLGFAFWWLPRKCKTLRPIWRIISQTYFSVICIWCITVPSALLIGAFRHHQYSEDNEGKTQVAWATKALSIDERWERWKPFRKSEAILLNGEEAHTQESNQRATNASKTPPGGQIGNLQPEPGTMDSDQSQPKSPQGPDVEQSDLLPMHLVFVLVGIWIAAYIKRLISDYAGDLMTYISWFEVSEFEKAREEIRRRGTTALRNILDLSLENRPKLPQYEKVIIVGHSLGSVIAYDSLNRLINEWEMAAAANRSDEQNRKTDPSRINLLTLGCPLDKIFTIYRTRSDTHILARRLLNQALQPFRDAKQPNLRPPVWFNLWSKWDPVSGPLEYFDLDREEVDEHLKMNEIPLTKDKATYRRDVINIQDPEADWPLLAHSQYFDQYILHYILCNLLRISTNWKGENKLSHNVTKAKEAVDSALMSRFV